MLIGKVPSLFLRASCCPQTLADLDPKERAGGFVTGGCFVSEEPGVSSLVSPQNPLTINLAILSVVVEYGGCTCSYTAGEPT